MTELISELEHGAALLRQSSFNPVSLSAGVDLLLRFVTLQRPSISQPFAIHKRNLVARAKEFVQESHRCVDKIVGFATDMIKDDAVGVYPIRKDAHSVAQADPGPTSACNARSSLHTLTRESSHKPCCTPHGSKSASRSTSQSRGQ